MKFITTIQTPLYQVASNGFFTAIRSLPAGTEVTLTRTGIDDKSGREIGYLPTGEIVYTDVLTRLLDEVETRATRLWDWLIVLGIAGFAAYKIYNHYRT